MFHFRAMTIRQTLAVLLVGMLVAFGSGYFLLRMGEAGQPQASPFSPGAGDIVTPGDLDIEAVERTQMFAEFPLVWLGEEFEGLRLTRFVRLLRPNQDAVGLVYGECDPAPGEPEPSCVPPISIVISRAGSVPAPSDVSPEVAGDLTSSRGAPSRTLSGSPHLWTDGAVIAIHAEPELAARIIAALRSANHQILHSSEVEPNEPLSGLGE